jgi:chromate reductase, NAD(P)H dehydrogenase (quinone)
MIGPIDRPLRLLGIAGSLRRGSFSSAVLASLAERAPGDIAITCHSLGDVPLYNADDDTEAPPAGVRRLWQAIGGSDGLVIVTPEYNYGIPGVLKNALDWASRPGSGFCLRGKPVLTLSVSPGATGAARAHCQLVATLDAVLARALLRPQITIGAVADKVQEGRLTDPASLAAGLAGLDDLRQEILRLRTDR